MIKELIWLLRAAKAARAMLSESSFGGNGRAGASAPMEEAVYEGRQDVSLEQGER